jgi:hypothetical protein
VLSQKCSENVAFEGVKKWTHAKIKNKKSLDKAIFASFDIFFWWWFLNMFPEIKKREREFNLIFQIRLYIYCTIRQAISFVICENEQKAIYFLSHTLVICLFICWCCYCVFFFGGSIVFVNIPCKKYFWKAYNKRFPRHIMLKCKEEMRDFFLFDERWGERESKRENCARKDVKSIKKEGGSDISINLYSNILK